MVRTTVTLALGLLLMGRVAVAQTQQPWLADRRYGEGSGIRSGDLEVHPGVAGEVGYDSNFFQGSGQVSNTLVAEPVVGVGRLRLTPSLSLRTLGAERRAGDGATAAAPQATFYFGSALRIDKLVPLEGGEFVDDTLIGGDVGAEVDVGPSEPFGAALGGAYSRVPHPTADPGLVGPGLDHNRFGGHLDLRWRPSGGILSWTVGYAASVLRFDNQDYQLDRAEHTFRTRGRYRFLPRTSLLYEGELGVITHVKGAPFGDAAPISSQLGINGLVTTRFSLLVMAGLKAMFFEPTESGSWDDFSGFVGRGEATWFLGASAEEIEGPEDRGLSHLRLGVQRDVFPGGISNYYTLNRGFLELTVSAGGVFVLAARAGHAIAIHATPRDEDGQPISTTGGSITEQRPEAGAYAEYRLLPTVALLGNLEFTASLPNNYVIVNRATFLQDNLAYQRFTALFGARWFL